MKRKNRKMQNRVARYLATGKGTAHTVRWYERNIGIVYLHA